MGLELRRFCSSHDLITRWRSFSLWYLCCTHHQLDSLWQVILTDPTAELSSRYVKESGGICESGWIAGWSSHVSTLRNFMCICLGRKGMGCVTVFSTCRPPKPDTECWWIMSDSEIILSSKNCSLGHLFLSLDNILAFPLYPIKTKNNIKVPFWPVLPDVQKNTAFF